VCEARTPLPPDEGNPNGDATAFRSFYESGPERKRFIEISGCGTASKATVAKVLAHTATPRARAWHTFLATP
jgi:hypothetical protein